MSRFTIDHPLVRRLHACPLCTEPKSPGCVWCWPCHRRTQNGTAQVRAIAEGIIDTAEAHLAASNPFFFSEREAPLAARGY